MYICNFIYIYSAQNASGIIPRTTLLAKKYCALQSAFLIRTMHV